MRVGRDDHLLLMHMCAHARACTCAWPLACARVCVRVHMCVCVCACVRACAHVRAVRVCVSRDDHLAASVVTLRRHAPPARRASVRRATRRLRARVERLLAGRCVERDDRRAAATSGETPAVEEAPAEDVMELRRLVAAAAHVPMPGVLTAIEVGRGVQREQRQQPSRQRRGQDAAGRPYEAEQEDSAAEAYKEPRRHALVGAVRGAEQRSGTEHYQSPAAEQEWDGVP